jgi:hypothetical protein
VVTNSTRGAAPGAAGRRHSGAEWWECPATLTRACPLRRDDPNFRATLASKECQKGALPRLWPNRATYSAIRRVALKWA